MTIQTIDNTTTVNAFSFSKNAMVFTMASSCCPNVTMTMLVAGVLLSASVFSLRLLVLCSLLGLCLLDLDKYKRIGKLWVLKQLYT